MCKGYPSGISRAVSTIEEIRLEQRQIFRKGAASKKWVHKFFCLHRRDAERVPNSVEKTFLEEAGLGEKSLVILMNSSPDELRDIILAQFPKLKTSGGFEFLHCQPSPGIFS